MPSKGESIHIDVYARVRPSMRASSFLSLDYANDAITVHLPHKMVHGTVNNQASLSKSHKRFFALEFAAPFLPKCWPALYHTHHRLVTL